MRSDEIETAALSEQPFPTANREEALMPWFKVDDDLAFHHKTVAAGNAAMGLWVRAGSWSAQTLTDGFIPNHMVATLGNTAQARKLVEAGLWTKAAAGYTFHEWADRQPTRVETEQKRSAARERMRRVRGANFDDRSTDVRANNARTDDARSSEQEGVENPESDRFSTESERNVNGRNQSVTDSFEPPPDEYDQVEVESPGNVRANFARSDANPVPSRPVPYTADHVGGDRSVGIAREENGSPTPSKFHPEHPDGRVSGCDECDHLEAAEADRAAATAVALASRVPPERCPEHLDAPTTAPCGPCGEQRRARQAWDAERARWQAERAADARLAAAQDRAREIADCGLCDDTGYRGTSVCDHDPDTVERAKRGSALVRATLAARRSDAVPEAEP